MDARKLAGMTEGAKKRYARSLPVERFCMSCKTPLRMIDEVEPTHSRAAQFIDPESMACPKCGSETDSLYPDEIRAETRAFYRIGQRLRPCPGCHTCMPGAKGWHIDKVRGRFKMPTIAWSCDGSGVLPARAKKVRR